MIILRWMKMDISLFLFHELFPLKYVFIYTVSLSSDE